MFIKNRKFFICVILIFQILFSNLYCYGDDIDYSENSLDSDSFSVSSSATSAPSINSRSAIVLERSTGTILYGKNENDERKMASTTKIMTCIVVLENVSDLSTIVTVSKKSAGIGGSRLGLSVNAKITVNDLLYGLMLCSGNDAAIALAEFVGGSVEGFSELMNKKVLDLGLEHTHFITPHGLDDDQHYTTAYELAMITNYALNNETFKKIVGTHSYSVLINNNPKSIHNTNELLGYLNGVYGVKTGFTNGANRCLVSACKREDLDIICIVLGADTKKFRTQDSIKLIEYTFSNFQMVDICSIIERNFADWQNLHSSDFHINKGINSNISTSLEDIKYKLFPVNKSNLKDVYVEINCNYYYEAPLLKNSTVGALNCYIGNSSICELKIFSTNTVEKKNIISYIIDFFKNYSNYLERIFEISI